MKKLVLVAFICLFNQLVLAQQEACETPENQIVDPNEITKCSVEDVKKTLETIDKKVIKYRKKRKRVAQKNFLEASEVKKIDKKTVTNIDLNNDVVKNLEKIPFHLVEQIPLFKKCENTPLIKQMACFEKQMRKHLVNNFTYPQEALKEKIEGKILVQFVIDETGSVVNIKKRGPEGTDILKDAAVKLIAKLPDFIAGQHKGKNVKVKYALPINFKLPKS